MKSEHGNFFDSLQEELSNHNQLHELDVDVKRIPCLRGQCIYVMDYKNHVISFQRGIKEMLGYEEHEFNFNNFIDFIHPEDRENVTRLIYATIQYARQNPVNEQVVLCLTYRILTKSGKSLKVMRQSSIQSVDEHKNMLSNFSILTDVSFLDLPDIVEWKFDAPLIDQEKFRKYVNQSYQTFFTNRELDILALLKSGITSKLIADKLFLSKHTVDTHRRNMLRKTNSRNTIDLLEFYSKNVL